MHARRRTPAPRGDRSRSSCSRSPSWASRAVGLNVLGVGDRVGEPRPPDRAAPRPAAGPAHRRGRARHPATRGAGARRPRPTPAASRAPGETPPPAPTPTPVPARDAVDVDLLADPEAAFITEIDKDWCAVAGTQMVLAMHGKAPLTEAFQPELAARIGEWESRRDSKNGGWGPVRHGEGARGVRRHGLQGPGLRDPPGRAASTPRGRSRRSGAPVILLTWRGAHTWVMTGLPGGRRSARVRRRAGSPAPTSSTRGTRGSRRSGARRIRRATYQDLAEMRRNYLPWERPEGLYPKRDGLFIAVVPTEPLEP